MKTQVHFNQYKVRENMFEELAGAVTAGFNRAFKHTDEERPSDERVDAIIAQIVNSVETVIDEYIEWEDAESESA